AHLALFSDLYRSRNRVDTRGGPVHVRDRTRRRDRQQVSVVQSVSLDLLTQELPIIRRRNKDTVEQLSDLPGLGEVMSPRVLLQSRTRSEERREGKVSITAGRQM